MQIEKEHKDYGNHVILDLYCCNESKLYFSESYYHELINIIKLNKATVLNEIYHCFDNNAYTLLVLLGESHVSFHTFPEDKYVAVDIYTCGHNVLSCNIVSLLIAFFESDNVELKQVMRNNPNNCELIKYSLHDYMTNDSILYTGNTDFDYDFVDSELYVSFKNNNKIIKLRNNNYFIS